MYKIDYEKLGIYIGKKATEYFGNGTRTNR